MSKLRGEALFQDRTGWPLSPRQIEMERMLYTGRSMKEIAHLMHLTYESGKVLSHHVMRQQGWRSRPELMAARIAALESALLPPAGNGLYDCSITRQNLMVFLGEIRFPSARK